MIIELGTVREDTKAPNFTATLDGGTYPNDKRF